MLQPESPALVLAPMEGITDAPMRALQGETGAFDYAVSEFLRVSGTTIPAKVFRRDVPELENGCRTPSGLPVQVQILGGDPDLMAESALGAVRAGAKAVDINFGCPAPMVNRHDGGASLLRYPTRIRDIVHAIRRALPVEIPVSAKLRLGWDSVDPIHENAAMAAEGGASWLTIHARTRMQGYTPPVYWSSIGKVREALGLPVIANGDIWTLDDFRRCRDETGCCHFMIGRGALANPSLPYQIARELGRDVTVPDYEDWYTLFWRLVDLMNGHEEKGHGISLMRLKQWMKLAHKHGEFRHFDTLKQARTLPEFFEGLSHAEQASVKVDACGSAELPTSSSGPSVRLA